MNWNERKEKIFLERINRIENELTNEFYHPKTMTKEQAQWLVLSLDNIMTRQGYEFDPHICGYKKLIVIE
jgi:hypothetical protein